MARIQPFRALRYDAKRVDLSQVIAPPYDVVARDERGRLYDRDPHNAVRLELTRNVEDEADTDYSEVRTILDAWQKSSVLLRDPAPAIYALRQSFEAPDGSRVEREGFFASLQLEDYATRVVRPHERTLAGPKADRLRMLRATGANLSPIFMLYDDRERKLEGLLHAALEDSCVEAEVGEVTNRLAVMDDPARTQEIRDFLADRALVIADGHHRYETALAYRDERRAEEGDGHESAPYESTLVYFANAFSPGTLLLPIHRVIQKGSAPTAEAWARGLPGWSSREVALASAAEIRSRLAEVLAPLADKPAFVADDGSGTLRLFWQEESLGDRLMVRILEDQVIGDVFSLDPDAVREGAVAFPKSAERAASDVRIGEGSVALYINPLQPEDVFRVTAAGEVMPQKSTFYYPKIPTGLVFRVPEVE